MDRVAGSLGLIPFQLETLLSSRPFHRIANAIEQFELAATLGTDSIYSGLVHPDQDATGGLIRAGGIEGIEAVAS